jgi:hypothetical protein
MTDAPSVSEPMTWGEICERFPDQWIMLVALDWTDERDQPLRTALIAGSGTRDEAVAQARPLLKLFDKLGPYFTGQGSSTAPATGSATAPPLPPIVYLA